jgi:hypothetical protein
MHYSSGEIVEVGDSVALEYGKTPGLVHAVIESPQQIDEWGWMNRESWSRQSHLD